MTIARMRSTPRASAACASSRSDARRRRARHPARSTPIDGLRSGSALEHRRQRACTSQLPLVGGFQIENALVAVGLVVGTGGDADAVFAALDAASTARRAGSSASAIADRRADLRRLRAQAGGAGEARSQALRPYAKRQAGRGVRLRRRPRSRQAAADGRDRGRESPISSSSPTTIRAARTRPRSAPRSWPRRAGAIEIGDRAEAIRAASRELRAGRRAADRRQGPRDRPDRRRPGAAVQRSRGGRGRLQSRAA